MVDFTLKKIKVNGLVAYEIRNGNRPIGKFSRRFGKDGDWTFSPGMLTFVNYETLQEVSELLDKVKLNHQHGSNWLIKDYLVN